MDSRLVGSWHLEGVSTLLDRPDPDAGDEVWKPDRTAPQRRAAMRRAGYVFHADGTGQIESRRDPPMWPPASFTWQVEIQDQRIFLILSRPNQVMGRLRVWFGANGQKMLWSMYPTVDNPPVAGLLLRDDAPAAGRKTKSRRTRR